MKINELGDSETKNKESEMSSDSPSENRKLWFTAQEIAGLEGMPTTDRRVRDLLEQWSEGLDGVKRKRRGTKAFEYHLSVLPKQVAANLNPDDDAIESPTLVSDRCSCDEVDFMTEFALIPGYRVQVSAGHGTLTQGELEPCRYLAFRRKWLRWRGFEEKELAIVWSKGDSMEPTIFNNDTLVVHLGRTRPVDGHIYVVRNDDQLWVKRLQVLPSAWLLLSDNKHYEPIKVPKDEQHNFEVIGQVVHIAHDVGE